MSCVAIVGIAAQFPSPSRLPPTVRGLQPDEVGKREDASMKGSKWIGVVAVAVVALVLPASASEIEGENAAERLYLSYCSACHGTTGRGDGTLAAILEVEPTDLTQFASANGGVFPFRSVLRAIDGRTTVRAHGDTAMPVWGKVFAPPKDASMREQLESYGKMFLITFHIEELQLPAESSE